MAVDAGRPWPIACGLTREQSQPARVRLLEGLGAATTSTACRIGAGTDTFLLENAPLARLVDVGVSREGYVDGGGLFSIALGVDGGASVQAEAEAGQRSTRLWTVAPVSAAVGATVTGTPSSVGGYGLTFGATPLGSAMASGATREQAAEVPAGALAFRALTHAGPTQALPDGGCSVDAGASWVRVSLDAGVHAISKLSQPQQLRYELVVRDGQRELARLTDSSTAEDVFSTDGGSVVVGFSTRGVPACGRGGAPAAVVEPVQAWLR